MCVGEANRSICGLVGFQVAAAIETSEGILQIF
jgi:hypothetical protein